jgi:hypothetical protein
MKRGQKGNSTWYERAFALTDLGKIKLGELFDSESFDARPKWYAKVLFALMSQGMPAIPLKRLRAVNPNKVGRFWGQKFATLYAFGGKGQMMQGPHKTQAAIDSWEKRKAEPGAAETIRRLKILKEQLQFAADNTNRIEQNLLKVFKLALEQPIHQEAVEFFKGFATGLSKPGIKGATLAGETDASPIYKIMLARWQEVDRLPSVPKLREFLIQHGMSEQVVGDISRLRRLCTRIGYAPGKRGRPSKKQK